jgi:hypothetical protein
MNIDKLILPFKTRKKTDFVVDHNALGGSISTGVIDGLTTTTTTGNPFWVSNDIFIPNCSCNPPAVLVINGNIVAEFKDGELVFKMPVRFENKSVSVKTVLRGILSVVSVLVWMWIKQ